VDVLGQEVVSDKGERTGERASVRVTDILKSDGSHSAGEALVLYPYFLDENYPSILAEHLEAGKRYLVAFYDRGPFSKEGRSKSIGLDPCGVLADTPEVRAQLGQGAALNDHLRQPELRHFPIE
jgi:hypothetical protein